MIGFHFQGNSDNWPSAVAHLPKGTPVKFVDGIQRAREAKAANPGVYTVVRHHVHAQNLGPGSVDDMIPVAREFFASFVDDSFRKEAKHIDAVQEWNEYYADSQGPEERQKWVNWTTATVRVWQEYRQDPDYSHIDLILAEVAVGNDVPVDVARLSHNNDWVHIGYHPYVPVWRDETRPDAWRWYSGRWEYMDEVYRANGLTQVTWFFGEFGAVGHNGPGWPNSLAARDGWLDDDVYDGDMNKFMDMMVDWAKRVEQTLAWKQGRVLGAVIFTTGGGDLWRKFEVNWPDTQDVAIFIKHAMPENPRYGGVVQPPPEPPEPENPCKGQPRVQYDRVYWLAKQDASLDEWLDMCRMAYPLRRTVGFSADDAGIGNLENKTVVIFGDVFQSDYIDFFNEWYPGTKVDFHVPALVMPVRSWTVTQRWGENYDEYFERFGIPGHNGIDFGIPTGSQVLASSSGLVTKVANSPQGYGIHVVIRHYNGLETTYAHLSRVDVQVGDKVLRGDSIALSGNTGYSTGPHLHLGVKKNGMPVDPEIYLGDVARRG